MPLCLRLCPYLSSSSSVVQTIIIIILFWAQTKIVVPIPPHLSIPTRPRETLQISADRIESGTVPMWSLDTDSYAYSESCNLMVPLALTMTAVPFT